MGRISLKISARGLPVTVSERRPQGALTGAICCPCVFLWESTPLRKNLFSKMLLSSFVLVSFLFSIQPQHVVAVPARLRQPSSATSTTGSLPPHSPAPVLLEDQDATRAATSRSLPSPVSSASVSSSLQGSTPAPHPPSLPSSPSSDQQGDGLVGTTLVFPNSAAALPSASPLPSSYTEESKAPARGVRIPGTIERSGGNNAHTESTDQKDEDEEQSGGSDAPSHEGDVMVASSSSDEVKQTFKPLNKRQLEAQRSQVEWLRREKHFERVRQAAAERARRGASELSGGHEANQKESTAVDSSVTPLPVKGGETHKKTGEIENATSALGSSVISDGDKDQSLQAASFVSEKEGKDRGGQRGGNNGSSKETTTEENDVEEDGGLESEDERLAKVEKYMLESSDSVLKAWQKYKKNRTGLQHAIPFIPRPRVDEDELYTWAARLGGEREVHLLPVDHGPVKEGGDSTVVGDDDGKQGEKGETKGESGGDKYGGGGELGEVVEEYERKTGEVSQPENPDFPLEFPSGSSESPTPSSKDSSSSSEQKAFAFDFTDRGGKENEILSFLETQPRVIIQNTPPTAGSSSNQGKAPAATAPSPRVTLPRTDGKNTSADDKKEKNNTGTPTSVSAPETGEIKRGEENSQMKPSEEKSLPKQEKRTPSQSSPHKLEPEKTEKEGQEGTAKQPEHVRYDEEEEEKEVEEPRTLRPDLHDVGYTMKDLIDELGHVPEFDEDYQLGDQSSLTSEDEADIDSLINYHLLFGNEFNMSGGGTSRASPTKPKKQSEESGDTNSKNQRRSNQHETGEVSGENSNTGPYPPQYPMYGHETTVTHSSPYAAGPHQLQITIRHGPELPGGQGQWGAGRSLSSPSSRKGRASAGGYGELSEQDLRDLGINTFDFNGDFNLDGADDLVLGELLDFTKKPTKPKARGGSRGESIDDFDVDLGGDAGDDHFDIGDFDLSSSSSNTASGKRTRGRKSTDDFDVDFGGDEGDGDFGIGDFGLGGSSTGKRTRGRRSSDDFDIDFGGDEGGDDFGIGDLDLGGSSPKPKKGGSGKKKSGGGGGDFDFDIDFGGGDDDLSLGGSSPKPKKGGSGKKSGGGGSDFDFDIDFGGGESDDSFGFEEGGGKGGGADDEFGGLGGAGGNEDDVGGGLGGLLNGGGMGKISPLDMADERRRRTADKTKEAVGKAREFQDFGKRGDRLGSTDWMKGDLQAPDVQWESREKKNIRTDADIYTAAHDTIPALDFLGTGYDALKGNPIGDPETSVDPGYRKPVVRFGWSHDAYGVTNDLSLLQPRGGYVRPFVSCRQSQTAEEVSSMSDYEKQLDVDASVGGGNMFVSFSASTSFRDMAKTFAQSDMKSFFIKTYCFRYEAGLANSPSINWNVTYGLEQSLRDLPTHFDGLMSTSTCQAFVYRSDPQSPECEETGVAKWMNLFNQYGTHVVTNVKLGGKIVHQVFVSKKAVDQLKDKGLSVSAQLSAGVIGFSASAGASTTDKTSERRADESLDKKVVTYVVGGRPPKDPTDPSSIVLWSKTVEDYPMPVQFELQPIRNFLPEQFRKAYDLAAAYYGLVHGMSQSELDQLANKEVVTLSKRLSEGHSLVWGGPPPGRVMCPGDEVIIAGFSLSFNFLDSDTDPNDYHLTICTPGLKLCEGKVASGKSHDDTRIWAVCGKSSMLGLRQFVIESLVGRKEQDKVLELHCPNGMALAWGMKLGIGYGPGGSIYSYVGHCISGKQTCRMRPRPQASRKYTRRFMYGACIEESYPGLRELSGISSVGDVGYVETKTDDDGSVILNCGTDRHILLGWALEAHTRMQATRTHYQNCEGGKQICIMKGSGLDQAPLVGGERKFRDTHALMAWGICVRDTPENPDPAPKAEPIGGPKHPELYIP